MEAYKLGVQTESRFLAVWKFWKIKHTSIDSIVEGERFEVRFKFRNLGSKKFQGGTTRMSIRWPSIQSGVDWPILTIPQLDLGKDGYGEFPDGRVEHQGEAMTSGYGLIFSEGILSADNVPVELFDFDGNRKDVKYSVGSILAVTWTDLHTKYGLIFSAIGLLITAGERIISLLWPFLQRLLDP